MALSAGALRITTYLNSEKASTEFGGRNKGNREQFECAFVKLKAANF